MRPNPNLNQAGVHKKEMSLCRPASDLAILIVEQYAIPKTHTENHIAGYMMPKNLIYGNFLM